MISHICIHSAENIFLDSGMKIQCTKSVNCSVIPFLGKKFCGLVDLRQVSFSDIRSMYLKMLATLVSFFICLKYTNVNIMSFLKHRMKSCEKNYLKALKRWHISNEQFGFYKAMNIRKKGKEQEHKLGKPDCIVKLM